MSNLPHDPASANAERQRRVTERHGPHFERHWLPPNERMTADRMQSARANLEDGLKRITSSRDYVIAHPDSDSGWRAYDRAYANLESWARVIVELSGARVTLPAKHERVAARVNVIDKSTEWLEVPTVEEQPKWMATPESRAAHSAAIKAENERETMLRVRKITGGA